MAENKGKQFEARLKADWLKMDGATIDRLYDVTMGYRAISQVSDFIGYKKPLIFYLECKSHKGLSLPFVNITQFDKLITKVGIPGVRAGVVLWLYEKDWVAYIPISTIAQMKQDGKKSVGPKALAEGYKIYEIPSIKKRVFMESDYSILMSTEDGE